MEKKKIETIKKTQTKKGVQTISYYYIANSLTKREYFALKTMHALTIAEGGASFITVIDAVKLADALIDELNKTKQHE